MKLWRKRDTPPAVADDEETTVQTSAETARALEAAQAAGQQLAEVRAQRPQVERVASEIERENDRNGFYLLVRQALRSG